MLGRTRLVFLGIGLSITLGCSKPPPAQTSPTLKQTTFIAPPVVTPAVVSGKDASLDNDAPVVGVVVAGKARAYSLKAMSHMQRHVVNDLIDTTPVSIAYCDKQDCLRTYTSDAKGRPLELRQMGLSSSEGLMLGLGATIYSQTTGKAFDPTKPPLPLQALDSTRTTWKQWREQHPETEVYVGEQPSKKTPFPTENG